jgi:hypothetical protein
MDLLKDRTALVGIATALTTLLLLGLMKTLELQRINRKLKTEN